MQFKDLGVIPSIEKALKEEGYQEATPIQEKAIPAVLAGRDVLASAQTGTGKTAAFAIPTIQMICEENRVDEERNKVPEGWAKKKKKKRIHTLIITPTRELAIQIYDNFCIYSKHTKVKSCVIFGGVSQKPQEMQIARGVDVLIATPGRLMDLMNQQVVDISRIKSLVLDETDRMLDMGFIRDIRNIIDKTPKEKQICLFSATFPTEIRKLAKSLLNDPVTIQIQPDKPTVDRIEQCLFYVDKANKADLLLDILKNNDIKNCIVFTRTKYGADKLVRKLSKVKISAKAIHGDKSQGARQRALQEFTEKTLRVLVATDVAARGIDINDLAYVVNFDLPEQAETYIHRIGRTGRAGMSGTAISFCCIDEKQQLSDIQRLLRKQIPVVEEHSFPMQVLEPTVKEPRGRQARGRNQDGHHQDAHQSDMKNGGRKMRGRRHEAEQETLDASVDKSKLIKSGKMPKKLNNAGNEYIPRKRFQPGKPMQGKHADKAAGGAKSSQHSRSGASRTAKRPAGHNTKKNK